MQNKKDLNLDIKQIKIEGANVHNLKNISLDIPHNKFVVITGLSGSGKSSLAFDTLFAEGQRRYVESLSSYARQFLGRISKPNVKDISGLSPAIAIEQKVSARNPRSTVGTTTEIYDYLKLLFARVGRVYSPITGLEVKAYSVDDVTNITLSKGKDKRVLITSKLDFNESASSLLERIVWLSGDGYDRFFIGDKMVDVSELAPNAEKYAKDDIYIVIDRIALKSDDDDAFSRVADSVATSYSNFDNSVSIIIDPSSPTQSIDTFTSYFKSDGHEFMTPTEHLFSFNSPIGACPSCNGYGKSTGIDKNLIIQDANKSLFEDVVMPWRGESMRRWKDNVIDSSDKSGFPIHKPYNKLSDKYLDMLWNGCKYFEGINDFFALLEKERYKIQCRFIIARYTAKCTCTECNGTRLRKEALYVKVGGYTIAQLVNISITDILQIIQTIKLDATDSKIAQRIVKEITSRLVTLIDVGLEYLSLDRLSSTLSGGESQRINLATSLGSPLVGAMYILDEPSIGLHPRDTERLIKVLKQLRDLGNSVIVVEHDEEIIAQADHIIDIGPLAGEHGGEVVFQGDFKKLMSKGKSLTAQYMRAEKSIQRLSPQRTSTNYLHFTGVEENNLKNIDVDIPLGLFTAVTGVSGSGKSSLVRSVIYPVLSRHFNGTGEVSNKFKSFSGDINLLKGVEMIDQNPIGKSSRSNPVTYIKAYDDIRKLYSEQPIAKANGYTPSHFSFNIAGGRCDSCEGDGVIRVEMQFMADVTMECEECNGARFKDQILQVKYQDKAINEVLDMSVNQAVTFFSKDKSTTSKRLIEKLSALQNVGLGYIKLGQASSTLSGGESQRVKLASFLLKETKDSLIFIFDEPTTGLHFDDINRLLECFESLICKGHTIVVVEHNMSVVKCADYIIDLGADGGEKGGELIFQGTIDKFIKSKGGYTVKYLQEIINKK